MKPLFLSAIFFILSFGIQSCGKKNADPPSPPTPDAVDTLSVGWSKVKVNSSPLSDVFFTGKDTGYAAGNSIFKTTDGGKSWSSILERHIVNIFVTPNGTLFALAAQAGYLLRSTDHGVHFDSIGLIPGNPYDIFFTGNDTGYISGGKMLLYSTDAGKSWKTMVNNLFSTQAPSLSFINSKNGWVSGADTYKINGYESYSKSVVPAGDNLLSLYALSVNTIYAGSVLGGIYKSIDGGKTFQKIYQFNGNKAVYLDIHFITESSGYACWNNRIYQTNNGGITWMPVVSLDNDTVVEIHFTDPNHGWGCTMKGFIIRYEK